MIPRVIHYCWFGPNPLPEDTRHNIDTWRAQCPDYEIKEWNESNFPIHLYPYAAEAYEAGKYAFVSDVARLHALATDGGIYLDTDVELLKPLDEFLGHTAFTGFEGARGELAVTTGLMASVPGGRWISASLSEYASRRFRRADGSLDTTTNVAVITQWLTRHGLRLDNTLQTLPGLVTVYPREYFSPKDSYAYGSTHITPLTHAIHYYAGTWQVRNTPEYQRLRRKYRWIPYFLRKRLILAILDRRK